MGYSVGVSQLRLNHMSLISPTFLSDPIPVQALRHYKICEALPSSPTLNDADYATQII
jgi:hypothetical protein